MKTTILKTAILISTLFFYSCFEKKEIDVKPEPTENPVVLDSTERVKPVIIEPKKIIVMERNINLIGLWRNTEVLSSGSGDNYMSFSTDYFLEFQRNGVFLSWVGSSAGSGYSSQSEDRNNADQGEWLTSDDILILKDPIKQEETSVKFFAENGKLMLSSETSRKIYEKIQ